LPEVLGQGAQQLAHGAETSRGKHGHLIVGLSGTGEVETDADASEPTQALRETLLGLPGRQTPAAEQHGYGQSANQDWYRQFSEARETSHGPERAIGFQPCGQAIEELAAGGLTIALVRDQPAQRAQRSARAMVLPLGLQGDKPDRHAGEFAEGAQAVARTA
jgi:hypothetical protein